MDNEKKVKLTTLQSAQLDEYLMEKKELITTTTGLTSTTVVEWIRDVLKFVVTPSMLCNRVGSEGRLYKHTWPGSEGSRKGRLTGKMACNLVTQQLALVTKVLAMVIAKHNLLALELEPKSAIGKQLLELPGFEDVVKAAGEELADTDFREEEERGDSKVDNTFRPGIDPDPNPVKA